MRKVSALFVVALFIAGICGCGVFGETEKEKVTREFNERSKQHEQALVQTLTDISKQCNGVVYRSDGKSEFSLEVAQDMQAGTGVPVVFEANITDVYYSDGQYHALFYASDFVFADLICTKEQAEDIVSRTKNDKYDSWDSFAVTAKIDNAVKPCWKISMDVDNGEYPGMMLDLPSDDIVVSGEFIAMSPKLE